MQTKKLSLALVGCGGISTHYRAVYPKIEGLRVAVAIDIDIEEAKRAQKDTGALKVSTDFRDALSPEVDIVSINTPNYLHAEQAIACLKAHKHVILQKPMAPNSLDCKRIMAAAKKSRGNIGMYMSYLEIPLFYEIKDMIKAGLFGKITAIESRFAHRGGLFASKNERNWRGSLEKTGGGSFIQLAIHHWNLYRWMMPLTPVRVQAIAYNQYCPNIGGDDTAAAIIETREKIAVTLESGYASHSEHFSIYGTHGSWRYIDGKWITLWLDRDHEYRGKFMHYRTPRKSQIYEYEMPGIGEMYNPLNQQRAFIEAIRDNKPIPTPGEEGMKDILFVEAVYQAAKTGKSVTIRWK